MTVTNSPPPSLARRLSTPALVMFFCLAAAPVPVCAQRVDAQASRPAAAPAPAVLPASPSAGIEQDAQQTREQLRQILDQHPPSLREVLRLDPALLSDQRYLAPYPRLAAFLAAHPEVARSPVFHLGAPGLDLRPRDARRDALDLWRELLQSVSVGAVLLGLGLSVLWLVRTLLDYLRWQRISRVQVETHSKVLDRMTSSEDLLTYMQTPAGRQFLESAPIALDGARSTPMSAPLSRILWSVQAGLVIGLAGGALQFVSRSVVEDVAQPLHVLGILLLAIGVGFVLSAVIAFLLSRHLGLMRPGATEPADHAARG
ncbi:MAG: hypothetical protein ACR2LU_00955 [Luteitalea sp.]